MDDQHTTATNNSSEQAAEPDQQLLRAASSRTRRRRTTARMSSFRVPMDAVIRSYNSQISAMWQSHVHAEDDRPRSPRQPADSHTANININTDIDGRHTTATNPSQQAAEQPAINQHLLRAASEETRGYWRVARLSSGPPMRRRSGLALEPEVWEFLAQEAENNRGISQRVTGANPTPAESDRPRIPRHYPQPAEIPRPRPITPSARRWFRPSLLSLIPRVSRDSGRPSDRHQ